MLNHIKANTKCSYWDIIDLNNKSLEALNKTLEMICKVLSQIIEVIIGSYGNHLKDAV